MKKKETSWGDVASWYDSYLDKSDTYQSKVIWPNLERLLGKPIKGNLNLADIACGQGYFSFLAQKSGFSVTGLDIAPELIRFAEGQIKPNKGQKGSSDNTSAPKFIVAPANKMPMLNDEDFDVCICILALQNIKELDETFKEVSRILRKGGRFIFVINHPSFRIPQYSDWYFDQKTGKQNRIVNKYMQEASITIDMNPGLSSKTHAKDFTVSFHRPLQLFIKFLSKNGFVVKRLEEWCSHKKTEAGPRKLAEDEARKEIPMFMAIEAILTE